MICTSVSSGNSAEVLRAIAKYKFVEIRLDDHRFTDDEINQFLVNNKTQKIFTCRNSEITDDEKFELFEKVIIGGAELIDIEMDYLYRDELISISKLHHCEVILSEHYFEAVPIVDEIIAKAESAKSCGGEYFKIAAKCNSAEECLTLLNLYCNEKITKIFPKKLISLPMGNEWKSARITALSLGAPFIYVSSDEGTPTADGQISFGEFNKILEIFR